MIFILGIDALDYELVEKWNLNNLKQFEYGHINVPINIKIGLPHSPEVWASFLLGKSTSINFKSSSHFINILVNILDLLNIDIYEGIAEKVKKFMIKIGLDAPKTFGNLREKTFLDLNKSKEINVPFYNFENSTLETLYLWDKNKISLKQSIEKISKIYKKRKKQILIEIDNIEDEDIIFAFIHAIDILQHLSFLHISKIEKQYIDLDNYVSILKEKLENSFENVIFIIVSDHGFDFDIGNHSKYAFYSSNTNLIPKPEKITDFYKIILDFITKNNNP